MQLEIKYNQLSITDINNRESEFEIYFCNKSINKIVWVLKKKEKEKKR